MKSAFDINRGRWNIKWPGRVAKHDLVYLSPPSDPMQGIALGNGDVGVLAWFEGSKIIFVMNKCNLWDDAESDSFTNWKAADEEKSTTLRHGCRIILDFKMPIFDIFYLSDFQGRLNLAEAAMTVKLCSAFGTAEIKAFVENESGIFCCEVKTDFQDNGGGIEVVTERYGSRTFSHWYRMINRDCLIGLNGTNAKSENDGMYLSHKLSSGNFAVGCRIVSDVKKSRILYKKVHSHAVKASISETKANSFKLYAAITEPMKFNSIKAVKAKLADAEKTGISKLFKNHCSDWKKFWQTSLMECGDDYLDNLWHLTMYYANSSQRGKCPGRFISGLWGWNRDVQQWNFYFHWNQQQVYWPLNAAGHHDLIASYLDYRFNALPYSCKTAKQLGVDGAFVSDVADRRGSNSLNELENHTPVAQIAMDFWRQYLYTGDLDFLKNQALPYMLEASYFTESLFEKQADGRYHAKNGTAYEGWIRLRDSITELVSAEVLFKAVLDAIDILRTDEPRAAKWKDILNNLAELPVIKAESKLINKQAGEFVLQRGLFKGENVFSVDIFSAGFGIAEQKNLTSIVAADSNSEKKSMPSETLNELINKLQRFEMPNNVLCDDLKCNDGIFPWSELSAIFPSGLIGLGEKNSEKFKVAVNTAKLFAMYGMGWDVNPIVMARLGLSEEVWSILARFPQYWQFYCNGWGHYGPMINARVEAVMPFASKRVLDLSVPEADKVIHNKKPEKLEDSFNFHLWPFRHMGMEGMSVLSCTMNESLLQSYGGVIRVAPAVGGNRNGRFMLHSTGGFIVSSEIKDGKIRWISIKSKLGNTCKVWNLWKHAYVLSKVGKFLKTDEKVIEFKTKAGDSYMIVPDRSICKKWQVQKLNYLANKMIKKDCQGQAVLGIPRMF
jgi:hypothetical protein